MLGTPRSKALSNAQWLARRASCDRYHQWDTGTGKWEASRAPPRCTLLSLCRVNIDIDDTPLRPTVICNILDLQPQELVLDVATPLCLDQGTPPS